MVSFIKMFSLLFRLQLILIVSYVLYWNETFLNSGNQYSGLNPVRGRFNMTALPLGLEIRDNDDGIGLRVTFSDSNPKQNSEDYRFFIITLGAEDDESYQFKFSEEENPPPARSNDSTSAKDRAAKKFEEILLSSASIVDDEDSYLTLNFLTCTDCNFLESLIVSLFNYMVFVWRIISLIFIPLIILDLPVLYVMYRMKLDMINQARSLARGRHMRLIQAVPMTRTRRAG